MGILHKFCQKFSSINLHFQKCPVEESYRLANDYLRRSNVVDLITLSLLITLKNCFLLWFFHTDSFMSLKAIDYTSSSSPTDTFV